MTPIYRGNVCLGYGWRIGRWPANCADSVADCTPYTCISAVQYTDGRIVVVTKQACYENITLNMYFRPLSYMDADVVVVCYSVADPVSLDNIRERWVPEVRHFCPYRPVVLAANKVDLRAENPADDASMTSGNFRRRPGCVSSACGEQMAEEIGAVRLVECSAKTRHAVREVFLAAASAAVDAQRLRRKRHKPDKCCLL